MYYVYELINLLGTVEYVGRTINPKKRKDGHFSARGKFYRRQDVTLYVVGSYLTLEESLQVESQLQESWNLPQDKKRFQGSKHSRSKLTDEQVKIIKLLLDQKVSCAELARRFEVTRGHIGHIKKGRAWTHV